MKTAFFLVLILTTSILTTSCSHFGDYKAQVLGVSALAGALGYIHGQSKPEQKAANSALYAGLSASTRRWHLLFIFLMRQKE